MKELIMFVTEYSETQFVVVPMHKINSKQWEEITVAGITGRKFTTRTKAKNHARRMSGKLLDDGAYDSFIAFMQYAGEEVDPNLPATDTPRADEDEEEEEDER